MYTENKKGQTIVERYGPKQVKELYKVTPKEFIDVKALMGDSSDNIPGVPGIGEKGATAIISEFGSIENAYENADKIANTRNKNAFAAHYDMAQMSKNLPPYSLILQLIFLLHNVPCRIFIPGRRWIS